MLKRMVLYPLIKLSFSRPIFNYVANKALKYRIIKNSSPNHATKQSLCLNLNIMKHQFAKGD